VSDFASLAKAHAQAVESNDTEALAALHEPDAEIWHNTDGVTQTLAQNLKVNAWLHRKVPDLSFEDVRIDYTDTGFIRRSVVTGTAPDGSRLSFAAALIVEASPAGKIAKVWEYLDSAPLAALSAR
jgi:ketosteroid isomerase-like protein